MRATVDNVSDKLGAKIRRSEIDKIPYALVVGAKEEESKNVTVRSRVNKSHEGTCSMEDFVNLIKNDIADKVLPNQ